MGSSAGGRAGCGHLRRVCAGCAPRRVLPQRGAATRGAGIRPSVPRSRLGCVALLAILCVALAIAPGCARRSTFDNVVLVTIDTLRADHLGCYGYPRPTSPFIDSLASRGIRFERAISASSHTAPSHASIFTSRYPSWHGVDRNGLRLRADLPTLASVLSESGFATGAVTSVRFLKAVASGFQHLHGPRSEGYLPADLTVDFALDLFESSFDAGRFALWVHFFDAHESDPRVARKPSLRPFIDAMRLDAAERGEAFLKYLAAEHGVSEVLLREDPDRFNRYDAQIRLVDAELERLFAAIERRASGSTLWVITADHGEGLGSHEYLGHGRHLYQEQLRVPLILFGGGGLEAGRVIADQVRTVDLFPTIVDLLGASDVLPASGLEGSTLRPLLERGEPGGAPRVAFAERRPVDAQRLREGWVDETVLVAQTASAKYIRRSVGEDEFYDLDADPLERVDLYGKGMREERELARWLDAKRAAIADGLAGGRPEDREVDPEYLEELRALGYVE